MFAMVARTGLGKSPRMVTSAVLPVRATHALLFLAATIVSPGVCNACTSASPIAGFASSVAATHCCRSPEQATAVSVADAGDGDQNTCRGCTDDCRCQLRPKDSPSGSPGSDVVRLIPSQGSATVAVAWLAAPEDQVARIREAWSASHSIPARPARVLYGVWRN
jgi:hypothetical protein